MKKLFALLLVVVMVMGMVACAPAVDPTDPPKQTTAGNNDATNGTTAAPDNGEYFPLKEQETLVIAIQNAEGFDNLEKALEQNVLWQEILEKTNVKVEWVGWTAETIQAMFANDEMGDIVICGGSGQDNLFNNLAGQGVIKVLDEYVDNPEVVPNITANMWAECPEARGTFTAADGNLYVMGTYGMDRNGYVEGYIWVYKPWLEASGVTAITDLASMEKYLDYVAKNDANGNGDANDEIPLFFGQKVNNGIESFLGLYGLPTKDGTFENYVTLVDGTDEVVFIPQLDEWKDFITLFNKWWEAGYLYDQMFTADYNESYTAWRAEYTDTQKIGMIYANANNALKLVDAKNWICIEPFPLGEAEVRWYIHPGYMGSKTSWCVPESSEKAELACRFMDLFYDPEVAIRKLHGEPNSPWRTTFEDGTFYTQAVTNDLADKIKFTANNSLEQLINQWPEPTGNGYYAKRLYTTEEKEVRANYGVYEKYLNKTVWPRPYTKAEDQTRLAELRTDIFKLVNEKRADWITGRTDIDAEWAQFQTDLEAAGIEEFIEIMQGAYDVWYEGYAGVKGE